MAATARKLMVEVVEARDLLPKDGTGTSSPYVVIDFDGQRRRTQTVRRELNPTWNEVLEFKVTGSLDMAGEPLEVDVLHDRRAGPSRRNNFLGRVRIDARQFVRKGEEALIYFPLEKKSLFNWVRGDIGLRIYYVDEPIVDPEAPPPPPPAETPPDAAAATVADAAEVKPAEAEPKEESEAKPAEETAAVPPGEDTTQPPPMPPAADGGEAPEAAAPEPPPVAKQAPEPPTEPADMPAEAPEAPTTESKPQEATPPVQEAEKEVAPRWVPQAMPPAAPERPMEPAAIEKSSYDLVDKMHYLFVRVVRARSLPGDAKPHVRVEALGRNVSTATARRGAFFEWDQTITFPRDGPTSAADPSTLEVSVWDLPPGSDVTTADAADKHFLGGVCFDVSEVPARDLPDSQLAPQWYRLEGGRGSRRSGDLMLATWIGTQADESFPDSLKADVDSSDNHVTSRSKVYLSPKLWYLRATVIEANDTLTSSRESGVYVKAALGFQVLKTRPTATRNGTPSWNEDLIFVAAEPFGDDKLVFSLELRHGKDTAVVGSASVDLSSVERRVDDRRVASRWLDLQPGEEFKKGSKKQSGIPRACIGGRLHVRVCLDGGYHVADEPPHSASDFRPSARQLWGPQVGTIELGLIGCKNLLPMKAIDGKGVTDAYAVAKYGPKWARTRTVPNSFDPAWNEQYTWPVYDPCTVLTVGVFDESDASKDSTSHPMGKIRIRISTLESNRSLRCSYPLIVLLPSGPKKMGEVEVAVRFSRSVTSLDLIHVYGRPMLPPMHHVRPIPSLQRDPLRLSAARIVAGHLSRSEPSLKREVVAWMLDSADPRGFSMRKVRSNYNRILSSLSWIADVARWVEDTRAWRNPTATTIAHGVMILLIWFPELIIPTLALHLFGTGLWRYRYRVRIPPADPSVKISGADVVEREELDEEFDQMPSTRGAEVVRARYDRVRAMGARVQGMLGDVAAQTERLHALTTWRDPRATGVFLGACLVVAMIMYLVPSRLVALVAGLYFLRHPVFRDRMPSPALNFFRRLPSLSDRIL
ncbi:putative protein QUIRKY [Iris pallida]|uniref:C2 domain-containing protein n=1 Tax=Iris pallida TaxID=29817 RepID=A0AAX6GE60_IRIPA|nr:putative protein QUIRKY [Iris pallida]